jgi:hypothetical protein
MPLPQRLVDHHTLVKNHDWKDHLVCVLVRIIFGIAIINGALSNNFIFLFGLLVVSIFLYKFIYNPNTWKVYLRTALAWSVIVILEYLHVPNASSINGVIAIVDALMGLQSRYIQANFAT